MEEGTIHYSILKKIIIRSIIIFLLGLILNLLPLFNFSTFRIPGVLQRIAVCYMISAIIFLFLKDKIQVIIFFLILAVYSLLLIYFPSCDSNLTCNPFSPAQNLCRYLDIAILGDHVLKNSIAPGLDPEGILSTLPSISSTLAGAVFGKIFLSGKKTYMLITTGFILILSGLILDKIIPVNKILWTPSYVLLMAGIASLVFIIFSFLIDEKKISCWAKPFIPLGKNALIIFFLSTLIAGISVNLKFTLGDGSAINLKMLMYKNISALLPSYYASLTYSLLYLSVWMAVAFFLHRKNIIIKI
jgi:predicted acyltransferase